MCISHGGLEREVPLLRPNRLLDGEDEQAAPRQHPQHRSEYGPQVSEIIQHVGGTHNIIRPRTGAQVLDQRVLRRDASRTQVGEQFLEVAGNAFQALLIDRDPFVGMRACQLVFENRTHEPLVEEAGGPIDDVQRFRLRRTRHRRGRCRP